MPNPERSNAGDGTNHFDEPGALGLTTSIGVPLPKKRGGRVNPYNV